MFKFLAIVTIESIFCAKPDKARCILFNAMNMTVCESILFCKMPEIEILCISTKNPTKHKKQDQIPDYFEEGIHVLLCGTKLASFFFVEKLPVLCRSFSLVIMTGVDIHIVCNNKFC